VRVVCHALSRAPLLHSPIQLIEDKTFGLKNKNKSKKVQQQIKSIEKSVHHSGDAKQRKAEEERKRARANAKALKKAKEEERNALFGEALLAVQKKGSTNKKDGKVEAKGRDADDDEKKGGTSRAMKMCVRILLVIVVMRFVLCTCAMGEWT